MTPELAHPRPSPTSTSITATPEVDGATRPTPPTPTAERANATGSTRRAPKRVISQPPAAVATTLPALNSARATAVRATGTPNGTSRVGVHDELTTSTPKATKDATHSSTVLPR